jgi:beta-glucosidase
MVGGANGVPCEAIQSSKPNKANNIFHSENAETADNDYTDYPKTVAELNKYGFGAYRMSISWSRVLSYKTSDGGKLVAVENKEGIEHYRQVLNALQAANVEVALTMWHWDTPEALENYAYHNPACISANSTTGSYWLCPDSNTYFQEYAELLVREFGTLAKFWITLNEPLTLVENGYSGSAPHAPGRCSDRTKCWDGNDAVEPFVVAHNLLRAHAVAFNAWKAGKNTKAGSTCGITLNGDYALPADPTSADDVAASERSHQYQMAIFADPIFKGTWPEAVVKGAGAVLPKLDPSIHGTHVDVYFQNHYTTNFVWAAPGGGTAAGFMATANISNSGYHPVTKKPIGRPSSNGWLFDYGPGIALLQSWLHKRYPTPSFVVTENGWGNATATEKEDVHDTIRCNYYRSYIGNMSKNAHDEGITVKGYFAWSIMDNYEWADGFSTRFGLTYVDYATQIRTPKLSMEWFKKVTQMKALPPNGQDGLPPCEP